jgi:hypothetical protein
MRANGNTLSNENYNPINKPPPTTAFSGGDATEDIELERYIRDKYERKSFMKPSKKLPPSPTFHRDPEKITAILGPPADRSPSLGSSSSGNLKPGHRVSGESFERARSPASTNSSVELPPPRPIEAGNPFDRNDPWAWAGLETKSVATPAPRSVYSENRSQSVNASTASLGNPFQNSQGFTSQAQPLPQSTAFPPPPRPNPFNLGETNFDPQRKETISQETQALLDSVSSPFHPSSPTAHQGSLPSTVYPQSQQPVYPRSSSTQTSQISAQNPFVPHQVQSPAAMSPTNPFFTPQQLQSPFTPVYQPQQQQPSYQTSQPSQRLYQPQPTQQQQPVYQQQQQPQPTYQQQQSFQPQPQQPAQSQYQQPQYQSSTFQPQSQPFNPPNPPYASPRMDKQSILNLFNTQPQPQILNQNNGVPAWNQQSNGW